MRVLVVTNMYPSESYPSDGIFVKRQIDALRQSHGDLIVEVCYIDTIRSKVAYIFGAWQVWRASRSFKPDLVHIHYGLTRLVSWPLYWKPSVITFHGSDLTIPWQRKISTFWLPKRACLIAVAEQLKANVPTSARNQVSVIPCGVIASCFAIDRIRARQTMNFHESEKIVLFGANPNRKVKRFDRFEKAIAKLTDVDKSIRVARLSDVPITKVPNLIAAADVLVLTSDREGSPIVTKEALCAGTRVVSTPVGDINAQLTGFAGCRVSGWSSDEIAAEIQAVFHEKYPDRVEAAQKFDVSVESKRVYSIYENLFSR